MPTGILELAIVFLIAALLGGIAKLLKQPTILAYLITGAIIGYFGMFHIGDHETFRLFSDLGIMFLLFLVGLEINYTSLRMVGKPSLVVGLGQIIFTSLIGFGLASLLGFATIEAFYIAVTLTFSSTIIVVQLLSDKQAINSLHGKISIGLLLAQDFIAILFLIILAGIGSGGQIDPMELLYTALKGIGLFALMIILGRKFFPFIFDKIAHYRDLLFISSIAWLFIFAALSQKIGFSIEIGGFLAGIALANSSENFEIASRLKPLRDFFILVFFVILGSSIVISNIGGVILPVVILSLFVLIGNPLIVLILMGLTGYEKRTGFLTGVTVAQISEFSLVVAALGLQLGHINEGIVALITGVAVVTITLSAYLIIYSDKLFELLSPYLGMFERRNRKLQRVPGKVSKPIVIFGFHRTGRSIAANLNKKDLFIVDFDPEVSHYLDKNNYTHTFGDITDADIMERIDLKKAKLVISTSPNFNDNLTLLEKVKLAGRNLKKKDKPRIILRAETEQDTKILYENGADYVLMPQFISGHYLSKILEHREDIGKKLQKIKRKDLKTIQENGVKA